MMSVFAKVILRRADETQTGRAMTTVLLRDVKPDWSIKFLNFSKPRLTDPA